MVHCVAFGCTNKSDRKQKDKTVHFFTFPKDKKQRDIWISLLKQEGYVWKESHRLCSDHFSKDQYEVDPEFMVKYGYTKARPKLKKAALPSFNYGKKACTHQTPRSCRFAKKTKKEVVDQALQSFDIENANLADVSNSQEENTEICEPEHLMPLFCTAEVQTLPMVTDRPLMMPRSTQVSMKPNTANKGTYCNLDVELSPVISVQDVEVQVNKPRHIDCNTQTDSQQFQVPQTSCEKCDHIDTDDEESMEYLDDEQIDPTYSPDQDVEDFNEPVVDIEVTTQLPPHLEKKYLVFHAELLQLFDICKELSCFCPFIQKQVKVIGTLTVVTATCKQGHKFVWQSQPSHRAMPWGNLCIASALLFSGGSFKKAETFFHHLQVPFISASTYYQIQRSYLVPVVIDHWENMQAIQLSTLEGLNLIVGGDGRCDSPGYCAKYGTYTMMDLERNKIIDIQIVQSNEVGGSCYMELEGLKRSLTFLGDKDLNITRVVTDRHVQVKKYMKDHHPDKRHDHDVWHMANGVDKKLTTAAKRKNGREIRPWIASIKNHMYWTASIQVGMMDL